ncbi:MAG: TMEM165/GDT1 family protein [Actinomycetes bacterium]
MDLPLEVQVFALVFPAELPDKTFVATLVLSTRYRPLTVWTGVAAAFAVQTAVAVTAGGLVSLLPRQPVLAVVAVLFAVGAVVLLRGHGGPEEDGVDHDQPGVGDRAVGDRAVGDRAVGDPTLRAGPRAAVTCFLVLFTAEWGDLSQLLTAGLAARYAEPVSVFVGAWVALATVAALAVLAGRTLSRVLPLVWIQRTAGVLFAVLAVVTAYEALTL